MTVEATDCAVDTTSGFDRRRFVGTRASDMVEKVLYPAYFDAELSRSEGRRLPTDEAVAAPTVEELAEAVQQVGYDVLIERDATYPREHEPRGRVLVQGTDDTTKNDLVRAVGAFLAIVRGE